jgi:DNA-binding response OmpR family regulator
MPAPSILIIEDDHEISESADQALTSKGYFVRVAPDARRGLSMALSYPPNLILLDYTLPDKDGLAVLSDIRASFELAHVPVIMISSRGYSQIVAQAIKTGVNDFLVKPFEMNILVERAAKFLQNVHND